MTKPNEGSVARFRRLYPELPDDKVEEAQDNFRRYVALALRIYEGICADPERYAQSKALTLRHPDAKVEERSKDTDKST